jgi:hypothetical protein
VWRIAFDSPEVMWEWWSTVVPPFVALLEGLEPAQRSAVHDEMLALAEGKRAAGRIEFTRDYVLILGRRR